VARRVLTDGVVDRSVNMADILTSRGVAAEREKGRIDWPTPAMTETGQPAAARTEAARAGRT